MEVLRCTLEYGKCMGRVQRINSNPIGPSVAKRHSLLQYIVLSTVHTRPDWECYCTVHTSSTAPWSVGPRKERSSGVL